MKVHKSVYRKCEPLAKIVQTEGRKNKTRATLSGFGTRFMSPKNNSFDKANLRRYTRISSCLSKFFLQKKAKAGRMRSGRRVE